MAKARNFLLNLVGILAFPFSLPAASLDYLIREYIDNKAKRDKKANDFLTHKIKERQILNDL
jgi:hypothetical protein